MDVEFEREVIVYEIEELVTEDVISSSSISFLIIIIKHSNEL